MYPETINMYSLLLFSFLKLFYKFVFENCFLEVNKKKICLVVPFLKTVVEKRKQNLFGGFFVRAYTYPSR